METPSFGSDKQKSDLEEIENLLDQEVNFSNVAQKI